MLNYIKSEFYRVSHNGIVYGTAGILAALLVFLNVMLWWFHRTNVDFHYATTSFSYSNLVANPMVYCLMAFLVAAILYESDKRNGNLKNTIAYGISRTKIFAGKCIVSLVTSVVLLLVCIVVYIESAALLLEHTGPTKAGDLLMQIPAVSLIAIAALILSILAFELFDKSIIGMVLWFALFFALPKALFYIGFKVELVHAIAMWMPQNFFSEGVHVNMSQCVTIWDTAPGMAKCLLSGAAGIIIFSIAGVLLTKKREI